MVAEEHPDGPTGDQVTSLAVLLETWRLKPVRNARWLRDLCTTFAREDASGWARYDRVTTLSLGIAALLDLSPWSRAAIRASAFVSALTRVPLGNGRERRNRKSEARAWEDKLHGWNWLQNAAFVLDGFRPGYDARQPLARNRREAPIETEVLALAGNFIDLIGDESGPPRTRVPQALHMLRSERRHHHDPKLVALLWSENGQAVLDRLVKRRGTSLEAHFEELKASVRLLDKSPPPLLPMTKRQERLQTQEEEAPDPSAITSIEEVEAVIPEEEVERGEIMKTTAAKEVWRIEPEAKPRAEPTPSLADRVQSAVQDLEAIKAAASRSQEALTAILPAMEELSEIVVRLQTSLQRTQVSSSSATVQPDGFRFLALRVELPQTSINVGEVVDSLSGLSDLQDMHIRDRGDSWVVLRAKTTAESDLALLEAKVIGAVARYLDDPDSEDLIKVTVLEAE